MNKKGLQPCFLQGLLLFVLLMGCSPATTATVTVAPSPIPEEAQDSAATETPVNKIAAALTQSAHKSSSDSPSVTHTPGVSKTLWEDVTETTIGHAGYWYWTNKVELADINGDALVDLLFANGGNYDQAGTPDYSRIFLNQGPDQPFKETTQEVFGDTRMLARVIKVRDVNNDTFPDILVGTTFQTQSQLWLGDGTGNFTNVTTTHLPLMNSSIGDLELGDVDGDLDLDIVLADWGTGNPMKNEGGRTMLWLNDGAGHFSDATDIHMPDILVKFSWELEFVDMDNDYDLDILVSCKLCYGYLFENDGHGVFQDATEGRLPQYLNNYDYEAMDVNADGYLDLVTINDGPGNQEHLYLYNQKGSYTDVTDQRWRGIDNTGCDDNMHVFLDYDSDGDADLLIGSLQCFDRLLENNGSGTLKYKGILPGDTPGTLGIAVADLNDDLKLDVVMAQGENPAAFEEKVYFGSNIPPDSAPPVITLVEKVDLKIAEQPIIIRARVHDNKSPTMPHDWQYVVLRWRANGEAHETPMQWYGEYLWRAVLEEIPAGEFSYQVCAADAAGNEACAP